MTAAASGLPDGVGDGALWSCQISDYDPLPCKLGRAGDGWTVTKLMGSQRFKGTVTFTAGAIDFNGTYFCPWGDCTVPMAVRFAAAGNGPYVTTFEGDEIRLSWDAAIASEWGGAGYDEH